MRCEIHGSGIDIDLWLREFVMRTSAYAIRHQALSEGRVHVRLSHDGSADGGVIRCEMRMDTRSGEIVACAAEAYEVFEAVQGAADRLEVALIRRRIGPAQGAEPLAAA